MNRRRILTVCYGNICRSPLAAAVLTQLGGDTVEVRSAGIRDKWTGKPAHLTMAEAAAPHGYDLSRHRARQVDRDLMHWADTILAMGASNLAALHELADEDTARRLALYLGDRDVPDPFGQPGSAFNDCIEMIVAGAARHLQCSGG
ncbi:low molecular weight phosphotyrosine protein phosphatase [Streptomyces sp. uw30]|uniref:low molecular weight protein-tyrosine-phosphatase n=1 Tax=Streptomyces sp. uw30 TaxID=1828179 RepID=UPI0011CDA754|nr:low molecular weight protein-tyrosine-phosphatase [Streptomyces sp. uw30]TXS41710.1 low molecular weight phosphotyrosine protein phosphatase [Streptomyces sp. uw30]